MKSVLCFYFLIFLIKISAGQYYIKNSGIKTSLSARNQIRQQSENQTTENYYVDQYGNRLEQRQEQVHYPVPSNLANYPEQYKPAEVYMGQMETHDYVIRTTPTPILDPIAAFINKTRSEMADGVCYKEVPTSSLPHSKDIAAVIGNGTTPDMSRIQICCPGYERNPHIYLRCDPVCKNDCQNGICTAPNKCVCLPGNVPDNEGNCHSTCPVGCANGICADNGECQCKPGYELELKQKKYCIPYCAQGCQHGRCVAPNTCACQEGYRSDAEGRCEPICEGCENGECTAPGQCKCHEGYQKVNSNCEPICHVGCENGRCTAPNVCTCEYGYAFDFTVSKCVPACDRSCVNGVCTKPNHCECNPGFKHDEVDNTICNPICTQECVNGYCSAPNLCRCNPGFVKAGIKGRLTCRPM